VFAGHDIMAGQHIWLPEYDHWPRRIRHGLGSWYDAPGWCQESAEVVLAMFPGGHTFGVLFITWLQYSSLYEIQKLCIYCMVVWTVTIPIFWMTTAYNVREKNLKVGGPVGDLLANHPGKLITIHYLIVILLILTAFPTYFRSLI
jgi:hypothetical protein